jgi:hypothetical protein
VTDNVWVGLAFWFVIVSGGVIYGYRVARALRDWRRDHHKHP